MDADLTDLLRRRERHLPPNLSVLYPHDPVHVIRARGQFLYDRAGREYLDCMNNVPHVGHSHPAVAQAISRQLALVDTNTRFLYEGLVDYTERLCALLPDPLEVCYLVNSGSEANELALRLARAATGRRGVVALTGAYHGNTGSLVDISHYKFAARGGQGRPEHVQVAAAPDAASGPHRGPDAAQRYVAEVDAALARAQAAGHPAGMFVAEPLMSTAGQVHPPAGYLSGAYEAARRHGALVVADEVQVGLGRVGPAFWACTALGGVPDVITLGKPIGNGFPLGAVVTTRAVADAFDTGMEWFNTFGGSPVACAAGLAVLDVLRDEELPAHAERVGAHLASGFRQLAGRHEVIGDVRGLGLFLGVELVADRVTRAPATAVAHGLVRALRAEGVLMSTDGPGDNVLKIKPPLVFDRSDADRVLEATDRLLAAAPDPA